MFTISILVMCTIASSTAVSVSVPGSAVNVIETETTILDCEYTSTDNDPLIAWYKGSSTHQYNIVIQTQSGAVYPVDGFTRHDIQDQASLVITDTQLSDADMYWCKVITFGDGEEEKSITLTVTAQTEPSQPSVSFTEGSQTSNEDSKIVMKCTSTGVPTPTFSWLRDGQPLPALSRYQLNNVKSKLTINPSHRNDNGIKFTCHVTNVRASKSKDITLNIRYAPGIAVCTELTTTSPFYQLNDEMKIRCQSTDGNPLATLHWYRGNNQIQGLSSSTNGNTVTLDYTWNLNRNDNEAIYMCEAINVVQTLTCQLGPFNVYFPAESVTLSGITNSVKEGETKILTCTTSTSNPASQISWLKDNN
ncbi:cell adhesion molecule CEACAM6-like, partial [Saccoglossus kowalevskii]